MKKTLLSLMMTAAFLFNPAAANTVAPATAPAQITAPAAIPLSEISATAYIVQDAQSGQVLAGKNLDTQIEPASLTKLMTAYLAFKALDNGTLKPDQMLTVSDKGWKAEGSRMFLDPKKPASVSDLIKGLIVQSGNDAAITLAEAIGGSEEGFAAMMNTEAKRLAKR